MRNFIKLSFSVCLLFLSAFHAYAAPGQQIQVHGVEDVTINNAVMLGNSTMVPIRTLSEALGLEVMWLPVTKSVVLWNDDVEVRTTIEETEIQVNSDKTVLAQAPVMIDSSVYLPLRGIAEVINADVVWNSATGAVDVYMKQDVGDAAYGTSEAEANNAAAKDYKEPKSGKAFFYQSQPDWGFQNGGRGYCWVCSYAMAITEATGKTVTPSDVAAVNERSGSGAYMQHAAILDEFNITFAPALNDTSAYFSKYDAWRGATYIKAEDDAAAVTALKEALDKNPQGVMVRYTVYPHTMYAVGYDENEIYFHDPAYENGDYITFDKTCLKNHKISDLDYIQAIASK